MPDAFTRFHGSMYSTSVTVGDWEGFITEDLTAYIDSNYRTLPSRESRGLAGHSMGGYGALRLGMKYPDVFSSIYLLSPCCMTPGVFGGAQAEAVTSVDQIDEQNFFTLAALASAAAWAPNPQKPPFYMDLPTQDGEVVEAVAQRFAANAPLVMLDQYIFNLRELEGIGFDVGTMDMGIAQATALLHERLEAYAIPHAYEAYEGDHLNRIGERIHQHTLPFFSERLVFQDE
jgi:enterochelin esterase-like enzyme